jgi:integrase
MAAMPKPRYPHLIHERTNRGRMVWYFRIGKGPRIRMPDDFGTPEFVAAYNAALAGQPVTTVAGKPGKGSVSWLIARYRESSAWAALSETTRYQRDRIFLQITEKVGDEAFAGVSAATIRNGREARKDTPFMANNYLRAVKGLFAWATEAEYVTVNPAAEVKELVVKTEGHEPWTIDDIRRYEKRWPAGTRERVWLHVLSWTGLRLGDACTLGWQHVRDGNWVALRAEKTGEWLEFPLLPPLLETLQAGPTGDLTFIINAHDRPFVKESFGNAFRDACREAGIKGKSAHGLRKMLAGLAAEMGASEEQLQAWFGWQTNRMSGIYTRGASKKLMAGKLADLFGKNMDRTESPRAGSGGAGNIQNKPKKSTAK